MRQVLEQVGKILRLQYPVPDTATMGEHFQREWQSYWQPSEDRVRLARSQGYLLSDPEDAIETDACCLDRAGIQYVLIGGSDEERRRWHSALGIAGRRIHPARALVVGLSHAPVGAPATLQSLQELLFRENPSAGHALRRVLSHQGSPVFVCFRIGDDRTTYAGLRLVALKDSKPFNYVHGAKAKHAQREQRRVVGWRVATLEVERADAAWVHGRGFDKEAALLRRKHVVLVGAGSLGGLVAQGLAHAGVGRLTIVDPESLVAANLGRHVLSARHLQQSKAIALAEEIAAQLPHVRAVGVPKSYQTFVVPQRESMPNLVISTAADWPADRHLLNQHATGVVPAVQLAWAETNAVAGHALLAAHQADRPMLLFDEMGRFERAATRWTTPRFVLPGCAGHHQPSTFNRLQKIAAMAVEQAVQYLTGWRSESEHLTWFGDELALSQLGGTWTNPASTPGNLRERIEARAIPTEIPP